MSGLGPFDIEQAIDRLRERVPLLRTIGGAADYVSAYERPGATPSAFVILAGESISTTPLSGNVLKQRTEADIDVAVAVRNYSASSRGKAQIDGVRQVVAQVRAALNGWKPVIDSADVIESMRGSGRARVLRYDADTLWWADRFSVVYHGRITT